MKKKQTTKASVKIQGIIIQSDSPEGVQLGCAMFGAILGGLLTQPPPAPEKPKRIRKSKPGAQP